MKAQITFHLTVSRPLRWADAGGVHWRSQRPRRHHGHAEEDDGPDARVNHHRGGPRGLRAPCPAKTLIISNYNTNQPPSKRERLDHWRSPGRRLMCCCQSETLCDGLWLVVQPPGVPSLRSFLLSGRKTNSFLTKMSEHFDDSVFQQRPSSSNKIHRHKSSKNVQTQLHLEFCRDSSLFPDVFTSPHLSLPADVCLCIWLCCSFLRFIFFTSFLIPFLDWMLFRKKF